MQPQERSAATMQECTWDNVRKEVAHFHPQLAEAIDEINPSKRHTFFRVRYPFGAKILNRGKLQLPNAEGELLPLQQHSAHVQEALGYNLGSNPAGILLENSLELFLTLSDRIISFYGLIPQGKLFGTWRMVKSPISHHPTFLWDMTAGARSLVMLPKITENIKHARMCQQLRINPEKPTCLLDHWRVFKQIANSEELDSSWCAEMLFFSRSWFDECDDPTWQAFYHYLLQISWVNSEFWRSEFIWDLVLSIIQQKRNIKIGPHITTTVKHLLAMSCNAASGFAPAIDDSAAPIQLIQTAYTEAYGLKDYAPIILQPTMFNLYEPSRPIYYSLQFPSAAQFSPKTSERATVMSDLYAVKSLLKKYLAEIALDEFNLKPTPLYDLIRLVKFDYFHTGTSKYHELRESKEIPKEDSSFILPKFKSKNFPAASSFVRGCIRISTKKDITKRGKT